MLESLSTSLKETLWKVKKALFIDETLINELTKDLQRSLIKADVNVKLVFEFTNKIKERALKEKATKETLITIIYEELTNILGKEQTQIKITKKPFKIMLVGLLGSGKSTTVGKLARYYKNRNYKVCSLGLDTYRPAAREQLKQVSDKIGIPCFIDESEKSPLKVYKKFKAEIEKFDIILIDTAGRHSLDKELIEELNQLKKEINSDESILVISADIGQAAIQQAQSFHEACNITNIIVTKMDGTARAGGALTASSSTGSKIVFIGTGEKFEDLEEFNPKGFISRILGLGDLDALLKKAEEVIDKESAEELSKRVLKGDFTLIDLYEQMQEMRKMGPISKLMELIPGMSNLKIPKEALQMQEGKLEKWKFIMQSMTKEELEDPEIIDSNRIARIAKGCGCKESEIRDLIKQYRQSKKMVKMMKDQDPEKLMKKFKGKLPGM